MFAKIKTDIFWRKQAVEVLLDAQSTEDDLINSERHVTEYAATGSPQLLIQYQSDTNSEAKEFRRLSELLGNDANQKLRLEKLNAAARALFESDKRVIGVFARPSIEVPSGLQQSEGVLSNAVAELEAFKQSEQSLLEKKDAREDHDYHLAALLLIAGSIAAAILLIIVNCIAGREIRRRNAVELKQKDLIEQLKLSLAQVKTLSGLIPICSWCKKIRSDKGYWQSVESYVCAHSDAKFTHGMCPECIPKWKEDLGGIVKEKA
jgi:CHASE3 domain sensor protein